MEQKTLVSVIIPTYSRPENIARAIDSVLEQTYKNIEIIVVDDNGEGTPYQIETEKVLMNYIANNKIKYIKHKVNKNGSAARNTGFRASQGEYVNFLDDDDFFMSGNIQAKLETLKGTTEDVGGSFCPVCFLLKDKLGNIVKSPKHYQKEGNILEDFLCGKALFNTSGILFKRDTIMDINGFDENFKRHQDFELMIRFFKRYTIKLASKTPLYYMDCTSSGAHGSVIKNRLKFEQVFLQKFKDDLTEQKCYHSVSHFLYWQCCLDYVKSKEILLLLKSALLSLSHGLFTKYEIRAFVGQIKRQIFQ